MLNQYLLKHEIGRGSYGIVMLAEDTATGREYAVKEFDKARLRKRNHSAILRRAKGPADGKITRGGGAGGRPFMLRNRSATNIHNAEQGENPLYLIRSEMAIMKKLDHENLIDLIEVLDDPEGSSLYMVLELCKKGVVMDVGFKSDSTPLDDETSRHFFRDLILGVEYLHAQGIAHRDIKPDNLLLSSDDVLKIVDFGVSEMFESAEGKNVAQSGSPAFMSPELCHGMRNAQHLKASDIWSMGVTLFCWKFGTLPFAETNLIQLCNDIMHKRPVLLDPANPANRRGECTPNLLDLLDRLLEKDPVRRIDMDAVRAHAWVTCEGEDELLSVEENTAQMVPEITEEDLRTAIKGIKGAVTVVKAVNRLKQMKAARSRSRSGSPERRAHAEENGIEKDLELATSAGSVSTAVDDEYVKTLAPIAAATTELSGVSLKSRRVVDTAILADRHGRYSIPPPSATGRDASTDERGRKLSVEVPEIVLQKRSRSMDAAIGSRRSSHDHEHEHDNEHHNDHERLHQHDHGHHRHHERASHGQSDFQNAQRQNGGLESGRHHFSSNNGSTTNRRVEVPEPAPAALAQAAAAIDSADATPVNEIAEELFAFATPDYVRQATVPAVDAAQDGRSSGGGGGGDGNNRLARPVDGIFAQVPRITIDSPATSSRGPSRDASEPSSYVTSEDENEDEDEVGDDGDVSPMATATYTFGRPDGADGQNDTESGSGSGYGSSTSSDADDGVGVGVRDHSPARSSSTHRTISSSPNDRSTADSATTATTDATVASASASASASSTTQSRAASAADSAQVGTSGKGKRAADDALSAATAAMSASTASKPIVGTNAVDGAVSGVIGAGAKRSGERAAVDHYP